MAWGSTFIAGLSGASICRLRLIFGPSSSPSWGGPQPSSPIIFTNYAESGSTECLGNECKTSGASLDPIYWRHNGSQLSVTFIGSANLRNLLDSGVVRGTIIELRVGWAGMTVANFEPVWFGQVQQIQWAGGDTWRIIAWDATTIMRAGLSTNGHEFFSDVGASAVVAAGGYTAGAGTLNVNTSANFQRETGSAGAVLVDDGTNPPFVLKYTGTTATSFTGVTGNVYGTTATSVAAGASVTELALLEDHPGNILRKFLASTGAGTNGAWDTLPSVWGCHIPVAYTDETDIGTWMSSVYGGSGLWQVLVSETVYNGREWLNDLLSLGGIHPVMSNGMLTCRMAQDPTSSPTISGPVDITADMVQEILSWEAFNPRHSSQSNSAQTYKGGDTINLADFKTALKDLSRIYKRRDLAYDNRTAVASTVIASYMHPWSGERSIDMSEVARDGSAVISSENSRLGGFSLYVGEVAKLRLGDQRAAQLACGDRIDFTHPFLFGYDESSGSGTYSAADCMVIGGPDVDWIGRTVDVELLKLVTGRPSP